MNFKKLVNKRVLLSRYNTIQEFKIGEVSPSVEYFRELNTDNWFRIKDFKIIEVLGDVSIFDQEDDPNTITYIDVCYP